MKATLAAAALSLAVVLAGCGTDADHLFPNSFEGSFIKTGIGPGPIPPTGPVSGHTSVNPSGRR